MWTIACQTPLSMGFFWQEYGVETYLTACEIDSLWGFAVWLRELKLGLCNSLEGWDGEGGGREETYVYLWLIHADIWQKPKEFCKAFILQLKNKKKKNARVCWHAVLQEILPTQGLNLILPTQETQESPALQEDSLPLSHHGSFPHCSDGKDSAYSTGDTGSIPGREDPLK